MTGYKLTLHGLSSLSVTYALFGGHTVSDDLHISREEAVQYGRIVSSYEVRGMEITSVRRTTDENGKTVFEIKGSCRVYMAGEMEFKHFICEYDFDIGKGPIRFH